MFLEPAGFAVDADVSTVARFVELAKMCAGVSLDWRVGDGEQEPILRFARKGNAAHRNAVRARVLGIYEGLTGERAILV